MDELVMAGFTDEEEEQLMDLLERLFANAEAIGAHRHSDSAWNKRPFLSRGARTTNPECRPPIRRLFE